MTLSFLQEFLIAEASDEVIVYQARRLHVRVRDRWPDEAESPLLEILAECFGFGRSCRDLSGSFPAAEFGLSVNEPPAVGVKNAELLLDLEKRTLALRTAASIFNRLRMICGSARRVRICFSV